MPWVRSVNIFVILDRLAPGKYDRGNKAKGVTVMDMLEKLREMYLAYDEKAAQVKKGAKVSIWGMGEDPRNHPCHEEFYNSMELWVREFLESQPDGDAVAEAAKLIIEAAAHRREKDSFWFTYAAQAHVIPMIGWMNPQMCRELVSYYDSLYTRLERLPVQRDLYKKLVKAGKGK